MLSYLPVNEEPQPELREYVCGARGSEALTLMMDSTTVDCSWSPAAWPLVNTFGVALYDISLQVTRIVIFFFPAMYVTYPKSRVILTGIYRFSPQVLRIPAQSYLSER